MPPVPPARPSPRRSLAGRARDWPRMRHHSRRGSDCRPRPAANSLRPGPLRGSACSTYDRRRDLAGRGARTCRPSGSGEQECRRERRKTLVTAPPQQRRTFRVPPQGGSMGIIVTLLIGFIVGVIAKLLMPGKDPGGFIVTTLLGIAGAFLAKFIGQAV